MKTQIEYLKPLDQLNPDEQNARASLRSPDPDGLWLFWCFPAGNPNDALASEREQHPHHRFRLATA